MKRLEYVAALRELADYIEAREFPEQIRGWLGDMKDTFDAPNVVVNVRSKEEFSAMCRGLGSFEKERTEYSTGAVAKLPSGVTVKVTTDRANVCTKRVVGTKIIPAQERVIEEVPEHEVEIVEWECPESFLNLDKREETDAAL